MDSLASKAKVVVKEFQRNAKVNGICFGKDAAAVNLFHEIKDKASTGHPSSFKTFFIQAEHTNILHSSLCWKYASHIIFSSW